MTYCELSYTTKITRRHHPDGYGTFQSFKDWLRDEFVFRCVYCLEREMVQPSRQYAFSVEHIKSKKEHPELLLKYTNLVYACSRCNSRKGQEECLNPIDDDLSLHLRIEPDGIITALTTEGNDLIKLLHLNVDPALSNRRAYIDIIELYRELSHMPRIERTYKNFFKYPDLLPDLSTLRPPYNHNPSSLDTSFHQLRLNGTLDETY